MTIYVVQTAYLPLNLNSLNTAFMGYRTKINVAKG